MKNILFLTTTPTAGGNGDALISAAIKEAKEHGAICICRVLSE